VGSFRVVALRQHLVAVHHRFTMATACLLSDSTVIFRPRKLRTAFADGAQFGNQHDLGADLLLRMPKAS